MMTPKTPKTQSLESARFNCLLADCSAERLVDFLVHENDDDLLAFVLGQQAYRDAVWALRVPWGTR